MNNKQQKTITLFISINLILVLIVVIGIMTGINRASAVLEETLSEVNELTRDLSSMETASDHQTPLSSAPSDDENDITSLGIKGPDQGLKDGVYIGSGQGYGGLITIQMTVEDGAITKIEIVNAPGETPAYFNLAKNIIPVIIQSGSADVDGVSGATLSSNGIKAAAASAIKQAGGSGDARIETADITSPTPKGTIQTVSYTKPGGGWKDGTYTGSATGFGGTVTVTVTIKDGKITDIKANGPKETSSYWSRALNVISRILNKQSPSVDSVSGATYSSSGIKNAVASALNKAGGKEKVKTERDNTKKETRKDDTKDKKSKDEEINEYKEPANGLKDGKYTGKATGYGGEVKVTVTIKNGKITDIKATGKNETEEYWTKALKMIKRIIKKQTPNVDTISGATLSSNGIRNAVIDALNKARASGRKDQFITSEEETYLIDEGESVNIGAKAKTELSYKSSDPSIASVDENGVITGVSVGNTTITITAKKTEKYNKAKLTVSVVVFEAYEDPQDPDNPDNPDNPDTPDNPDQPDQPDNPDTPDAPDTPAVSPDKYDSIQPTDAPAARDSTQTANRTNEKPAAAGASDKADRPSTGDDPISLYAIFALMMIAGVTALIFGRASRKRQP